MVEKLAPGRYYGLPGGHREVAGITFCESAYPPEASLPAYRHEHAFFYLVLEGRCTEACGHSSESGGPSTLVYHPPGEVHANRWPGAGGRCFHVELSHVRLEAARPHAPARATLPAGGRAGEPPGDWSLLDQGKLLDPNAWLKVAIGVLNARLSKADPDAGGMFDALFNLLGLTGDLPSVGWGKPGSDGPLAAWFRSLAQSPALMNAWLKELYVLFHPGTTAPAAVTGVTGTGSLGDPWRVELFAISQRVRASSSPSASASLRTNPRHKCSSDWPSNRTRSSRRSGVPMQATIEADVQLLSLTLPANGSATVAVFPRFDAAVVLASTDSKRPLLPRSQDNPNLEIGSVRFGFSWPPPPGSKVPVTNLQLVNVVTEIGSWPLLDLAQLDLPAIKTALGTIAQTAIQGLLGIPTGGGIPDNPQAAHLAAVIGVIPPPAGPSPWPLSPDGMLLSASQLPLVAANPLTALAAYYARALSPGRRGSPVWQYLLVDLAGALGGTGTTLVKPAATGQAGDPWQVLLGEFGGGTAAPAAFLSAWQPPGKASDLIVALEVSIPVSPPTAAAAMAVSVVVELLHLGSIPRHSGTPEGQPVAARCARSPAGGTVAASRVGLLRPMRPADGGGLSQCVPDGELLRVLLGGQPACPTAPSTTGGRAARHLGRRAGAGGPGAGGAGA